MRPDGLAELDWDDISKPGCYLMIASGLLARVHPEDLIRRPHGAGSGGAGARVALLSENPRLAVDFLRAIAIRGNYRVGF